MVGDQGAVAVDGVEAAVDVVDAGVKVQAVGVYAGPVFAEEGDARRVADRSFDNVGACPVAGGDIVIEAEAEQRFGLVAVAGAAGDAVEHGAGFCACQRVFRTEGAVFVAADPAEGGRFGNGVGGPVVVRHIAEAFVGSDIIGEVHENGDKLGAGDGVVRAEAGAVGGEPEAADGAHRLGEPVAVGDIGVGAGAGATVWISEQAIEEGDGFSTGDAAAWAHGAIRVAGNVGNVVAHEGWRRIIGHRFGGFGRSDRHGVVGPCFVLKRQRTRERRDTDQQQGGQCAFQFCVHGTLLSFIIIGRFLHDDYLGYLPWILYNNLWGMSKKI